MRCKTFAFLLAGICLTFAATQPAVAGNTPRKQPPPWPLYENALKGPLKNIDEVIFCTRAKYDDGHWYANIGYYCDDENKPAYAGNGKGDVGTLCKYNHRTKEVTVILDAEGGSIRDPQVHYDAKKILFSYRKSGTDFYHLYEINIDGSGLRQITSGEFDDYEPAYLPDGDIIFVSTRCKRWVNCWMTQVGIIYRCDADGGNIHQISANTEHDNTPWVLPDGRILYTRWEYVDRSQVEFHALWTMNPDGTGETIYYGNMHPSIVMIDAKPIPGTNRIVASFSPGHGRNEHAGVLTIVSPKKGPDDRPSARSLHRWSNTRDPYALSDNFFLCAQNNRIVLMDNFGRTEIIYERKGDIFVHEPRPIAPRPRERVIAPRTDPADSTGRFVLTDVYNSRNLEGVKRGEIKKLLVLESLPKPVNFSGGPDMVSWLGTFTLERVLGTVPVEEDGSAFFEVPANRQVFFVALDENDLSIERMHSFARTAPGETTSCIGCHEHRQQAPANKGYRTVQALQRPPSKIARFEDHPDVIDFNRDVQPILDRHCVECHNYDKREGQVILAGDQGTVFSHSFFQLFANRQVADGRNGLGNYPPREIGTSASPLMKKIDGGHYDVKVSPHEWRTVWMWIESGAAYAGSYAGLRNEEEQARAGQAGGRTVGGMQGVLENRCFSCHNNSESAKAPQIPYAYDRDQRRKNATHPTGVYERIVLEDDPLARFGQYILVNFTHPEKSPILLGPLSTAAGGYGSCGDVFKDKDDPGYKRMLAAIEAGKAVIEAEPRYGTPGFKPNRQYIRELKKYGILPESFDLARDNIDIFEADQNYWRSLWYQPPARSRGM